MRFLHYSRDLYEQYNFMLISVFTLTCIDFMNIMALVLHLVQFYISFYAHPTPWTYVGFVLMCCSLLDTNGCRLFLMS